MKTLFCTLLVIVAGICQSQPKKMCITVDDLPVVNYSIDEPGFHEKVTQGILTTFKKHNIPAIGYVNEKKLYTNGQLDSSKVHLLELWLQNGCELGNHTYSHMNYHLVSFEEFTEDILKGEQVTKELVKKYNSNLTYFRHPYLRSGKSKAQSDSLRVFLKEHAYAEAPVTIDNTDYLFAKAYSGAYKTTDSALMEKIGHSYLKYMEEKLLYFEKSSQALFDRNISQILLVHASLLNAEYLDELIEIYKQHEYEFVSQSGVLEDEVYNEKVTKFGNWGISWIDRWALSMGKRGDFFKEDPKTPKFILDLN